MVTIMIPKIWKLVFFIFIWINFSLLMMTKFEEFILIFFLSIDLNTNAVASETSNILHLPFFLVSPLKSYEQWHLLWKVTYTLFCYFEKISFYFCKKHQCKTIWLTYRSIKKKEKYYNVKRSAVVFVRNSKTWLT